MKNEVLEYKMSVAGALDLAVCNCISLVSLNSHDKSLRFGGLLSRWAVEESNPSIRGISANSVRHILRVCVADNIFLCQWAETICKLQLLPLPLTYVKRTEYG